MNQSFNLREAIEHPERVRHTNTPTSRAKQVVFLPDAIPYCQLVIVWDSGSITLHDNRDTRLYMHRPPPSVSWVALPKWAMYACKDKYNVWYWFSDCPRKCVGYWSCLNGLFGRIPKEFEPEFEGSWEESLIRRPDETPE